eukprot:CAMPEP_0177657350 /NCGR_PEP_ID=MMETSP0447-20121125/16132_1 /TAXON_ID=0 /ORGANISM="Stygamoeba regulata, Strain BSH-02190019" /LENGTH=91 /DNA_ID=CAMNT_0019161687 /DNA_START=187 /DNA_END=462 /DNA_ORIENTATION=-
MSRIFLVSGHAQQIRFGGAAGGVLVAAATALAALSTLLVLLQVPWLFWHSVGFFWHSVGFFWHSAALFAQLPCSFEAHCVAHGVLTWVDIG